MHDGQLASDGERTTLDLPLEVKADGAPGTFEGYGAVFGNTDRDGDVVAKGAFAESLKARLPALLWQHNAKEPIGRFDVVREDERGLYVRGRLSMTGKGAEAYELLKMGALNGLSIGFVTKEAVRNRATGTRMINRADLMEVSLVTFPANELARVSTVKAENTVSAVETPRDFERMLRGRGFSRARAKAITAKGFKSNTQDGLPVAEVLQALHGKADSLRNTVAEYGAPECKDSKNIRLRKGQTLGPIGFNPNIIYIGGKGVFHVRFSGRDGGAFRSFKYKVRARWDKGKAPYTLRETFVGPERFELDEQSRIDRFTGAFSDRVQITFMEAKRDLSFTCNVN